MTAFTMDQFAVFIAVVDCGGFASAARKLGRAQSAVTYAIKSLETQSGLVLFDRSSYRPALTDAGRTLLPKARRLLADLDDYGRHARAIAKGLEADLTVVTDEFAPLAPLAAALRELQTTYPSIHIRLMVLQPKEALEYVLKGQAHLGLLVKAAPFGTDYDTAHWDEHDLVAVAAPTHPLAHAIAPIAAEVLSDHMQVIWTPLSASPDSPDMGVHGLDRWHTTSLVAKHALLLAGAGWGSMPIHLVTDDIENGRLRRLELQSWEGSDRMPRYATAIVRLKKAVHGPGATLLFDALFRRRVGRAPDNR